MTTKYVTYCTKTKLDCGFTPNAQVILCVQDSALIVQPEPLCGLDLTTLIASVCSAATLETGCQQFTYQYTFSYNDQQITEPSTRPLIQSDITGVICEGCFTDWIMQQISCIGGANCVEDSDSIDFSLTADSCITGDVIISADANNQLSLHSDGLYAAVPCVTDSTSINFSIDGSGCVTGATIISPDADNQLSIHGNGLYAAGGGGGGAAWELLGNAGTVDGTNFLGTTDNIALSIRVNNLGAIRIDSGANSAAPNITGNAALNTINFSYACHIVGGGYGAGLGTQGNKIQSTLGNENRDCTIFAGYSNIIEGASSGCAASGRQNQVTGGFVSAILSGKLNLIDTIDTSAIGSGVSNQISGTGAGGAENFLGGGFASSINNSNNCFIGGGSTNTITSSENASIVGGTGNTITDDADLEYYGSIIGGGENHLINLSLDSGILSGDHNQLDFASADLADAGGGYANVICGGTSHVITVSNVPNFSWHSTYENAIVGGDNHTIQNVNDSFIGGGGGNLINGDFGGATLTLGQNMDYATICGGLDNEITTTNVVTNIGHSYQGNTIGGGIANQIRNAGCSCIPGGQNLRLGDLSFGYNANGSRVDLTAFTKVAYFGNTDLWIGNSDSTARKVKFFEPNADLTYAATNYSSFEAQAQAANIEYKLPSTGGTAGQSLKISVVAGNVYTLVWG